MTQRPRFPLALAAGAVVVVALVALLVTRGANPAARAAGQEPSAEHDRTGEAAPAGIDAPPSAPVAASGAAVSPAGVLPVAVSAVAVSPQGDALLPLPAPGASADRARPERLDAPLLAAIRGRYRSEGERRAAMVSAVESSGASTEPWTEPAGAAFDAWRASAGEGATATAPRCYRAGCLSTVTFPSAAAYSRARDSARTLALPWGGSHALTPAVAARGESVEATWILLRPGPP